MSSPACLRARTLVNDHVRYGAVDDVVLAVKVQQLDGAHFARRTARTGRRAELPDVCMGVARRIGQRALARTVVGLVALRRNDPVPAELVKVHCQWVAAAACLARVLVAVQRGAALRATLRRVLQLHFHERTLQ